jgi:hypothetical protein
LVETGNGEPALEDDLTIKSCAPDIESNGDDDLDWSMEQDRSADDSSPRAPEVPKASNSHSFQRS